MIMTSQKKAIQRRNQRVKMMMTTRRKTLRNLEMETRKKMQPKMETTQKKTMPLTMIAHKRKKIKKQIQVKQLIKLIPNRQTMARKKSL